MAQFDEDKIITALHPEKAENHCKQFLFCEIDAFDITKKYKPREKKVVNKQPTLF